MASAGMGLIFVVVRDRIDTPGFIYASVVTIGSFISGAAIAAIAYISRSPLSRARRRLTLVLLWINPVLSAPLMADEVPSFARNGWLFLCFIPWIAYAVVVRKILGETSREAVIGTAQPTTSPRTALGTVRRVIRCNATLGTIGWIESSWEQSVAVDVSLADGGIEVSQHVGRTLFSSGPTGDFPDLQLPWSEIQTVEGRSGSDNRLKFTFGGGRGWSIVDALAAHGVTVTGSVYRPTLIYGPRPTRRLVVASIITGCLALLSTLPLWLTLTLAEAADLREPGGVAYLTVNGVAMILNIVAICVLAIPEFARRWTASRRRLAVASIILLSVMGAFYVPNWLVMLVWWGAGLVGPAVGGISGWALLLSLGAAIATLVLACNVLIRSPKPAATAYPSVAAAA